MTADQHEVNEHNEPESGTAETSSTPKVIGNSFRFIPFFGRWPAGQQLKIVGSALIVLIVVTVTAAYIDRVTVGHNEQYVSEAGKLLMLSQKLAKNAQLSLSGNSQAFDDLADSWSSFDDILTLLEKGNADLPATKGDTRVVLEAMRGRTGDIQTAVDNLQTARPILEVLAKGFTGINSNSTMLRGSLRILESGAQHDRAARLSMLLERIAHDTLKFISPGEDGGNTEDVESLRRDGDEVDTLLQSLPDTPQAQKVIGLSSLYMTIARATSQNETAVHDALEGARLLAEDSDMLGDFSHTLVAAYVSSKNWAATVMIVSGSLVLLLLIMVLKIYLDDSRRRTQQAELDNRMTQDAIMRLRNELTTLAEGDLTIRATVSEGITGAIADAVNFTIDELRALVAGITNASHRVTQAAGNASEISSDLLSAAERQSQEISGAGEAVQLITQSIQEVDGSAAQSSNVARRTLEVTELGASSVKNAIEGMNSIREQIQETAKRIKRLGESSQEIGEIVDLISDITEQTNVLALNAAIQAASAGDAGRGFSVVAEEVQRLAERSAEATKQIGALVKTIQSDTQDAVAAMEKSTEGVVNGARLSDIAGQSLKEIESVSKELASLINSISVSTQVQTDMAREVAHSMSEILNITQKTTEGTKLSNTSVSELANLATELKASVSDFKV